MCIKIQASWKPPHRKALRVLEHSKSHTYASDVRQWSNTSNSYASKSNRFSVAVDFPPVYVIKWERSFPTDTLHWKCGRLVWKFIAKTKTRHWISNEFVSISKKIPIETMQTARLRWFEVDGNDDYLKVQKTTHNIHFCVWIVCTINNQRFNVEFMSESSAQQARNAWRTFQQPNTTDRQIHLGNKGVIFL